MAWNPNVLASILGDARQYVEQDTREKKAASIKDLDRLYAEKMLGEQRDYNEEMLLEQQRIAQENAMRNLRQEILAKAGGFSGMGFSPEEEGRVRDLYEEQKGTAATLAAAELADLQAATLLKGRMPAKAAGRSSGMTKYDYQQQLGQWNPQSTDLEWQFRTKVLSYLGRLTDPQSGLMNVGLTNPVIAQAWDQVIGHQDHPWANALKKIMGGDRAKIPLFEVTKLTTTNADHQVVLGQLNQKLNIVKKIVHSEMMRQLRGQARQRPNTDLAEFAGIADIYGGDHAEKLVDRMIRDMMFEVDMNTGAIVVAPAGRQTGGSTAQGGVTPAQGGVTSGQGGAERRLYGQTGGGSVTNTFEVPPFRLKVPPRTKIEHRKAPLPLEPGSNRALSRVATTARIRSIAEVITWWNAVPSSKRQGAYDRLPVEEKAMIVETTGKQLGRSSLPPYMR